MSAVDRGPRHVMFLVLLALAVVGCGPGSSSTTPATSANATSSLPPPPSTAPSATAIAPTQVTTPAPTPTSTPSPSTACVSLPQTGRLPSDRLTGLAVRGTAGTDVVRFEFGSPSLTPAGPATGTLRTATPPFTEAGSGRPITLGGEHVLEVVFSGMSLMNDVGQPVFDGEREIRPSDPGRSLRDVVLFDESEGRLGFYIGYDGPSCVTLTRQGETVVLAITFGPGS